MRSGLGDSSSGARMVKIFLTHNPEDREAFYGRTLEKLRALGEVRLNPTDRNLTTAELIERCLM